MVKKLSGKGIKTLKFFHLLFVSMWFGGGVTLTLFSFFIIPQNPEEALLFSRISDFIDVWLIITGANGLIITGLIYSIWMHWGFFKHGWITVKWVLIVLQALFGTFFLGNWVKENVRIAEAMTGSIAQYPLFFQNLEKLSIGGLIQLILVIFLIYISVFKPWRSKKVKKKQNAIDTR